MKTILGLLAAAALAAAIPPDISSGLQNILRNTHKSKAYEYPTDLTRGIIPVRTQSIDVMLYCADNSC
jgi:hypothetical protein